MRVQQFIKKLNNTELGKGTTHEYYVLVPSVIDIQEIFDPNNVNPRFYDRISESNRDNLAQLTLGRESRIKGLGPYYRENNVCAGDEIIFERRDIGNNVEFFIDLKINSNIIIFQKNFKGFEALNFDRLENKLLDGSYTLNVSFLGQTSILEIKFKEASKKRTDSPEQTNFYDLIINGNSILQNFKNAEYIELEEIQALSNLRKVSVWQKYEFELPDEIAENENIEKRKNLIKSILENVVKKNGYELGSTVKGYVRFLTPKIKDIIPKTGGEKSNWIKKESFLFEFDYRMSYVRLKFVISPGEENNRKILSEIVKAIPNSENSKGLQWLIFYSDKIKVDFLSDKVNNEAELECIFENLLQRNKSKIEQFEKEVLKKQDEFTEKRELSLSI